MGQLVVCLFAVVDSDVSVNSCNVVWDCYRQTPNNLYNYDIRIQCTNKKCSCGSIAYSKGDCVGSTLTYFLQRLCCSYYNVLTVDVPRDMSYRWIMRLLSLLISISYL